MHCEGWQLLDLCEDGCQGHKRRSAPQRTLRSSRPMWSIRKAHSKDAWNKTCSRELPSPSEAPVVKSIDFTWQIAASFERGLERGVLKIPPPSLSKATCVQISQCSDNNIMLDAWNSAERVKSMGYTALLKDPDRNFHSGPD